MAKHRPVREHSPDRGRARAGTLWGGLLELDLLGPLTAREDDSVRRQIVDFRCEHTGSTVPTAPFEDPRSISLSISSIRWTSPII